MQERIRLYLGCGDKRKKGYINVDKYVSAPDVVGMDPLHLPYENGVVDVILTEHMLEHLGKQEVPLALKEWARVLKPHGKLLMNLPNLEWCLQQWLAKPEEDRWDWQLDTIFGLADASRRISSNRIYECPAARAAEGCRIFRDTGHRYLVTRAKLFLGRGVSAIGSTLR